MWGLIRKNLMVNKKNLLISMMFYIVFAVLFVAPFSEMIKKKYPDDYDVLVFVMEIILFLAMIIVFIIESEIMGCLIKSDEGVGWNYFAASSPIPERGELIAKYIINFMFMLYTVGYFYLMLEISNVVNGYGKNMIKLMIMLAAFFLIQSALEIPLSIRFGSKYGRYVKMLLFYIILIAFLMYGLYGELPDSFNVEGLIKFSDKILNDMDYMDKLIYVSGVTALFVYIISFVVSYVFFRYNDEVKN